MTAGKAIQVALGLLLFAYMEHRLGWRETLGALSDTKPGPLVLAIVVFAVAQFVRILKWERLCDLAGIPMTRRATTGLYFRVKFFGLITPGRVGEFLPAATARSDTRAPLISLTAFDRILEGVLTLALALFAGLVLARDHLPAGWLVSLGALALVGVSLMVLLYKNQWMTHAGRMAARVVARLEGWGPADRLLRSRNRLAEEVGRIQTAFRVLFAPGRLVWFLGLTLVAVAIDVVFWGGLFAAAGIALRPEEIVASIGLFNTTAFFAPTPGGIGVADSVFALFLTRLHPDAAIGSFLLVLRFVQFALTAISYYLFRRWDDARQ